MPKSRQEPSKRKCQLEECPIWFVPKNPRQTYCCGLHRKCAKQRRYRIANPEKSKLYQRQRYTANPEPQREYQRQLYAVDPEKQRKNQRLRYAANPEPRRRWQREYHRRERVKKQGERLARLIETITTQVQESS